jgi:hypothetical protein
MILVSLPFLGSGQSISLMNDGAKIDTTFAREDLQRDQLARTCLWLDSIIIAEQQDEIGRKDTVISLQSKQISNLQERYLTMSTMVVICEKDRKKERFGRKVFQYAFVGMTVVAFILGVK